MHRRPPPAGRWRWPPATSPPAYLRRLRNVRARIVAATIAAGLVVAACGSSSVDPAALQPIPGTTLQQLIADRNDPALMVILTEYTATVSVPTVGVNDAAVQALIDQVGAEADSGQIGSDLKSMNDAEVAAVARNPSTYFTSNQPVKQQNVTLDYQCTGSIVTPDGYIVTAAHCTQISQDELQQGYTEQGLKPIVDAQVQQFQQDNSSSGFDSGELQTLSGAVAAYLSRQEQVSNTNQSLFGVMFLNSGTGDVQPAPKPVSLVSQGNAPPSKNGPFGDKDVSIVKLGGYSNLPTVPVGNDGNVDAGQQLFVDGYPAAANAANINAQNLGTPTLSAGSVSAKKTSNTGVPLLETTSTITGGDSGGPGFDQNGVMVGTVSYGDSSYNYLIGASVVDEFLHEKNIQPRAGQTTTLFDTALNDYYRHYYKRALPGFQQVKALDPSHPTVDGFIQKSQTAIAQGQDQTPLLTTTQITYLIVAAAALVILAAAGGVAFFIVRRARRSRRASRSQGVPITTEPSPASFPDQPPAYYPGEAQPQGPPMEGSQPASPHPATTPTPPIGFTAQQPQPNPVVQNPAPPAAAGGAATDEAPAFTPPPGWAWDGTQWISTRGDPSSQ